MAYIELELGKIKAIADQIIAEFPDDTELLTDMLDGCTDLNELASRLVEQIENEKGIQAYLAEQISDRQTRKKRSKAREDAYRESIARLMDAASLSKLTLPEATLSRTDVKPKVIIIDADALPDELCTFTRKPDMAAIKALNELPLGASMDNGGKSLTVRTK